MTSSSGTSGSRASRSRKVWWWVGGGALIVVLAVVVGPWVYINFIEEDAPPPLTLADTTTTAGGPTSSAGNESVTLAGQWEISGNSTAGYRVEEILFGQNKTAAGRTNDVEGSMTIEGTTVNDAVVTVDLTTVESDSDRRDGQFRGRIMDVAQFPTATFDLTQPIALGREPAQGETVTATATGELTLRGTTRTVTADLEARRSGETIEVSGSIPIVFADYQIPNPSTVGVTTEDNGIMEFLVTFTRA